MWDPRAVPVNQGRRHRNFRAWFRFAFKWSDPKSRQPQSRAGMHGYRIKDKLAETWVTLLPLARDEFKSKRTPATPSLRGA